MRFADIFSRAARAMRTAHFALGYDAVSAQAARQRRAAAIETKGEDKILPAEKRNRIINLHRDMLRNSPESVSQDQQMRVNVVGWTGGKMFASFEDRDAAAKVMSYFNRRWARHAEFTFGRHFNFLLKTVLTAQGANGNVILVFDDGVLTGGSGTGRIRGFEGDEIASVPPEEFARHFPASYRQSEGLVYNASGMFCGAFVSTSQRGKKVFDPAQGVIVLRFDPCDESAVPNWVLVGDERRFNQGRSVPAGVAALATAVDLHETRASEAQASKLNAQMLGQILNTEDYSRDSSAFAAPGAAAAGDGDDAGVKPYVLKNLKAIGAKLDEVPPGKKIELFDTKRPNPDFPAYAEYMQGVTGAVRGLPRVYSTLRVDSSYTGYRGEQKIAEQSFREAQKELERTICDWAARCVIARALRLGLIACALPDCWWEQIAWKWPTLPEVSVKDAEAGRAQKLKNGVTSLTRELGPGELDAIIAERKREKHLFDEAGLVYPGEETVSGEIKSTKVEDGQTDEIDEPKENTENE